MDAKLRPVTDNRWTKVRTLSAVTDRANRFLRRRNGNIAMSFALTLVPMVVMVGLAVDLSRVEGSANQVQYALDSAVLAAARELQKDANETEIKAEAQTFFDASLKANNIKTSCGALSLTPSFTEYSIKGSVTCKQPTTVSGLVGMTDLSFTRKAETKYGVGKLDVAFMFDTSGSMAGSRMTDLKAAAKDAVKTILKSKVKDPGDVRIAIATYATSVNVGTDYFKKVTDQEPNEWACSKWKWNKKKKEYKCKNSYQVTATCVTGREGAQKYTDAAPGTNAWMNYATLSCNSATHTPLTDHEGTLISAIETLPTDGATAGHLGIAWSWYLISPEWSSIWPTASKPRGYDDTDTTKVAILMTDGEFNQDYMSNGDSFDHAKKFCDAMKAAGIQIYTVAFQAPAQGQEILSYCASNSGQYFAASSGKELEDAYQKIATSISDLRISH